MVFMLFKKQKDLEVVCMFLKNIFFITYKSNVSKLSKNALGR